MEIVREESDADSDVQGEQGWKSDAATIAYAQAGGVDRPKRVSREPRKEVQANVPQRAHMMNKFPKERNMERPRRKVDAIKEDTRFDPKKSRAHDIPTPSPTDTTPAIFKGVLDDELVPMIIADDVVEEVPNDRGDSLKCNSKDSPRVVRNVRARKGKAQSGIVNGILDSQPTLSLQELVSISPNVRRDLVSTLKAMRDGAAEETGTRREDEEEQRPVPSGTNPEERIPTQQTNEASRNEKTRVLRVEEVVEETQGIALRRRNAGEVRSELLKIEATVWGATTFGVIDSGSMVNMISAQMLEESGLPSVPSNEKSFKITGVNGRTSRCSAWIPEAIIRLPSRKLPTYGALYVLDEADFDLILGRP